MRSGTGKRRSFPFFLHQTPGGFGRLEEKLLVTDQPHGSPREIQAVFAKHFACTDLSALAQDVQQVIHRALRSSHAAIIGLSPPIRAFDGSDQVFIKTVRAKAGKVSGLKRLVSRCPFTSKNPKKTSSEFWKSYFAKFNARRPNAGFVPETVPATLTLDECKGRKLTPKSAEAPTSARNDR
jgi:hypothetical protein